MPPHSAKVNGPSSPPDMADAVADAGARAGRDDIGDRDAEIDDHAEDDERPGADHDAERPADLEVPHARIAPEPACMRPSIAQAAGLLAVRGPALPIRQASSATLRRKTLKACTAFFDTASGSSALAIHCDGVAQGAVDDARGGFGVDVARSRPPPAAARRLRSSSRRSRWRSATRRDRRARPARRGSTMRWISGSSAISI